MKNEANKDLPAVTFFILIRTSIRNFKCINTSATLKKKLLSAYSFITFLPSESELGIGWNGWKNDYNQTVSACFLNKMYHYLCEVKLYLENLHFVIYFVIFFLSGVTHPQWNCFRTIIRKEIKELEFYIENGTYLYIFLS